MMRRGAIESEESMEIRIRYKVISGALAVVEPTSMSKSPSEANWCCPLRMCFRASNI